MNTDVRVVADETADVAATREVAAVFADAERRFSRFRTDSELARVNRSEGPIAVSDELFAILVSAREYLEATDGVFDPGIGGALTAHGYDRSYAPGALDHADVAPRSRPGSFLEVTLDRDHRSVTRPAHLHIDLGGLAKGATVDAALARVSTAEAVEAGGDLAVRGGGGPVYVEVEHPDDPARTVTTLFVRGGAVATSAPNRRRWRRGGAEVHHIIDPRTQAPARSDLAQATVVAPTAAEADVIAKVAFILGARAANHLIERRPGVGACLVARDGTHSFAGTIEVLR